MADFPKSTTKYFFELSTFYAIVPNLKFFPVLKKKNAEVIFLNFLYAANSVKYQIKKG